MKIKQVKINNFRNIKNATYTLSDKTSINGKNFTGKTNVLQAIIYCLTGYLLDGSKDIQSIKSLDDTSVIASVELIVEDTKEENKLHSLKREYGEDWVTSRGSKEKTMKGHFTNLYINDIKYASEKGTKELYEKYLGIDFVPDANLNFLLANLNPLYLFENVDWKQLRQMIINIVGDVKIEDVYSKQEIKEFSNLDQVKNDMNEYSQNTSLLQKSYTQKLKPILKNISELQTVIENQRKVADVNAIDLKEAQEKCEQIEKEIDSLKLQRDTKQENPMLKLYEQELQLMNEQLTKTSNAEYEQYKKSCEEIIKQNNSISDKRVELSEAQKQINDNLTIYDNKLNELHTSRLKLEQSIELKKMKQDSLRSEFKKAVEELANPKFIKEEYHPYSIPKAIECPHCHKAINDELIQNMIKQNEDNKKLVDERNAKHEEDYVEERNKRKKLINEQGKALKTEIEGLEKAIVENTVEENKIIEQKNPLIEKIGVLENEKNCLSNLAIPAYLESEEITSLKSSINDMKNKIEELNNCTTSEEEINLKISQLKESKKEYDGIFSNHMFFTHTQDDITENTIKLSKLYLDKSIIEQNQILLEEIMKTKLRMLNENVKSVFGDVKFVLVESNIKEGSWNEVCYPLVKDEITNLDVPFDNASHAQKIIAATNIIEKIRQKENVPELPILIDELSTLDTVTLTNRLITNCQIIGTRCDDAYEYPTIKNL